MPMFVMVMVVMMFATRFVMADNHFGFISHFFRGSVSSAIGFIFPAGSRIGGAAMAMAMMTTVNSAMATRSRVFPVFSRRDF